MGSSSGDKAEIPESTRMSAVYASRLFDISDAANADALDSYAREVAGYVPPARADAPLNDEGVQTDYGREDLKAADNMWQDSSGNLKDVATDAGAQVKQQLGTVGGSALGVSAALNRNAGELAAGRAEGEVKGSNRTRSVQATSALAAMGLGRQAQAAESMNQSAAQATQSALTDANQVAHDNAAGISALQGFALNAQGYSRQKAAANRAAGEESRAVFNPTGR